MKNKRIKAIKQWLEPKSIRDIQVSLRFASFYWQFIQGFSYIATSLTLILKTIGSTRSTTNLKKTKAKAGGNSVVGNNLVGGGEVTN